MQPKHASLLAVIFALLVSSACAPSPSASGGEQTGSAAPQKEKVLSIALQREITQFDQDISGASGSSAWRHWVEFALEPLTAPSKTPGGPREMRLAAELPTQANGKWVINRDGTMDMTWSIVRNAKWHDGTPLTAEDMAFTIKVKNEPGLAQQRLTGGSQYIKGVTMVDPYTFTTHWSRPSILGRYGGGLEPLAKHIMEPVYLKDSTQMQFHSYFLEDYIGAGPFKLVKYEPASFIEFVRFDEYYLGPAKLNRVILKIIPDGNTMVANLLAGGVDVLTPPAVGMDIAAELRDRWQRERSGHQVIVGERETGANNYEIMVDPEYARPVNGMTNQKVRKAALHALNREELTEIMTLGQGQVARQMYHPNADGYMFSKDYIESPGFPWNYPYDLRKALQLMAEAGWTKGADGILAHSPSGERFGYQVLIRQGGTWLKQNSVIQGYWKELGIDLELHTLTPAEQSDNKFIGTKPGAANVTAGGTHSRYHSKDIPTEANNWTGGSNRGRLNDPKIDAMIERIEVSIADDQARAAYREYIDYAMDYVVFFPFYWEPIPWFALKGVTGIVPYGGTQAWWHDVDKN